MQVCASNIISLSLNFYCVIFFFLVDSVDFFFEDLLTLPVCIC